MAIDFPQGGAVVPPPHAPRPDAHFHVPQGTGPDPAAATVAPAPVASSENGSPARADPEAHVAPPSLLQIKILEILEAQAMTLAEEETGAPDATGDLPSGADQPATRHANDMGDSRTAATHPDGPDTMRDAGPPEPARPADAAMRHSQADGDVGTPPFPV